MDPSCQTAASKMPGHGARPKELRPVDRGTGVRYASK